MLFECLGYTNSELSEFFQNQVLHPRFIKLFQDESIIDLNTLFEKLHPCAEQFISMQQMFLKQELLKRLNQEMDWMSNFGQGFMRDMFERNIISADFEEELIQKIGFEFILNFDFREIGLREQRKEKFNHELIELTRFMLINDFKGFSFSRPLDRILVDVAKSSEVLDSYENFREHLDTEIVHFATVGSHQSGLWNEVAVFTSENIYTWRERVKRYLSFLDVILKNDFFKIYPGTIYIVETKSGEIIDRLEVYEEFRTEVKSLRFGRNDFLN